MFAKILKLRLLTALAILFVVFLAGYYFINSASAPSTTTNPIENQQASTKPWIEVFKPRVTESDRELRTGDELNEGQTVKTGEAGVGELHFADGSAAYIEPNTSFIIKNSSYGKSDKSLVVSIFINSGKILSKVVALATPQSSWEVKTPNAVAVVRGTEFSVAYANGKSDIKVVKDSVFVSVVNPATGKVIPGTETLVTAGDQIEITPETVAKKIAAVPSKVDTIANTTPVKIILETQANLGRVVENDRLLFDAILVNSDGSRKIITAAAQWQVIGPIGFFEKPGAFIAKLAPEVSELGASKGAVAVGWKDSATGKEFTAQSPFFEVVGFVPQKIDSRG